MKLLLLSLFSLFSLVSAFYFPGTSPHDFSVGDPIDLKVYKLTSVLRQLPYPYYYLPFCEPVEAKQANENLGEILRGDRIVTADNYEIFAKIQNNCGVVSKCKDGFQTLDWGSDKLKKVNFFIDKEYRARWIIDNMEGAIAHNFDVDGKPSLIYELGFPIGFKGGSSLYPSSKAEVNYLNNHVTITLLYHNNDYLNEKAEATFRIVGFELKEHSIQYSEADWEAWSTGKLTVPNGCNPNPLKSTPQPLDGERQKVLFTYSVLWKESDRLWIQRWEPYFVNTDPEIHWFSIINSFMIVLFLSGMVGMILMRTLRADFRKYNQLEPEEEAEETGWKLVHGDVFRPPEHRTSLSVLIGSGVQVLGMAVVTLTFALLGFLSPANRGGLGTAMIALFVVMAVFAGYFSVRVHKSMRGTSWQRTAVTTAVFLPGVVSAVGIFVNFFIWGQKSSGAVPFVWMLAVLAMWLGISLPLCLAGGYFAWKKPTEEPPVGTNQIPRHLPEQIWYMNPRVSILMGGILPFGAVFIELFFILSAIWGNQYYYIFGVLFLVFLILIITSAEITVVMCYFQLCAEDYHWWWRSFLTSGTSALYMFLYAIFYFWTRMEVQGFVPSLLYFSYSFVMSFIFFVMTGAVGFFSCMFFVKKIYASIKVD